MSTHTTYSYDSFTVTEVKRIIIYTAEGRYEISYNDNEKWTALIYSKKWGRREGQSGASLETLYDFAKAYDILELVTHAIKAKEFLNNPKKAHTTSYFWDALINHLKSQKEAEKGLLAVHGAE